MKKLMPILVVAIFLLVGLINFNVSFTEPPASMTTANEDANNLVLSPAESTTGSLIEPEADENSELGLGLIGPEPEPVDPITTKPVVLEHQGSRFKVTTNTAIVLNSPSNFENYSYEELVTVSGYLFEDNNSNGYFDNGQDIPIPLARVKISFGDEEWVETDEDGLFEWTKQNLNSVKGTWDLQVIYDGQYTINGSVWYDVDQLIDFNEDNDYYLDVNRTFNGTDWVYEWPGNGKFDPGILNESLGYYEIGDPIIRDVGSRSGEWDSGDTTVTDPLNYPIYGNYPLGNLYTYKAEIDYVPLIDEELPNTYDQSITIWADQDGDWDVLSNDVGEDGVGGTGDYGDGDGRPTPGEPYFDVE